MTYLAMIERERPGRPDLDVVREELERLEESDEREREAQPADEDEEEGDRE
jgi:hypothetical protein